MSSSRPVPRTASSHPPADPSSVAIIDELVEGAARALFGSLGLRLGALRQNFDVTPEDHDVASSVGFIGDVVRGAVLMTTRKDIVALAWPPELRDKEPSEGEVFDWTGELVNQLLGRVKNGLVPFGLSLEQSTPTVLTGWHIHRTPAATSIARRYLFDADRGAVAIYFDAAVPRGFVLKRSSDANLLSAAEGEVQLF
jgi:hypothetical protein